MDATLREKVFALLEARMAATGRIGEADTKLR